MNTSVYSYHDPRFNNSSQVKFKNLGSDETKFKITKPEKIGMFKLDENRQIQVCNKFTTPPKLDYSTDRSQFRSSLLRSPYPSKTLKTAFDLNTGFNFMIKKKTKHDLPEGLRNLLLFTNKNEKIQQNLQQTDIITWRGILTRLANGIYMTTRDQPEMIGVVKKGNKVHIFHPTVKEKLEEKMPLFLEKFCYQGRAFEKFVNQDPPCYESPVNENLEEVGVFQSKIGKYQVLYGAEMDGDNLEIKSTGFVHHDGQKLTLLKKSQKWWAQCFLVGVENLLIGYRSKTGIVSEVSEISASLLVKSAVEQWSWRRSLSCLEASLNLIVETAEKEEVLYLFKICPKGETRKMININNFPKYHRHMFRLAALSGASSVGLGAYGAHKVKLNTDEYRWEVFQTANKYHMANSTMLIITSCVTKTKIPSTLFLIGMFAFCAPLYKLAITGETSKQEKMLMPVGGISSMAAWLSMMF